MRTDIKFIESSTEYCYVERNCIVIQTPYINIIEDEVQFFLDYAKRTKLTGIFPINGAKYILIKGALIDTIKTRAKVKNMIITSTGLLIDFNPVSIQSAKETTTEIDNLFVLGKIGYDISYFENMAKNIIVKPKLNLKANNINPWSSGLLEMLLNTPNNITITSRSIHAGVRFHINSKGELSAIDFSSSLNSWATVDYVPDITVDVKLKGNNTPKNWEVSAFGITVTCKNNRMEMTKVKPTLTYKYFQDERVYETSKIYKEPKCYSSAYIDEISSKTGVSISISENNNLGQVSIYGFPDKINISVPCLSDKKVQLHLEQILTNLNIKKSHIIKMEGNLIWNNLTPLTEEEKAKYLLMNI